MREMADLDNWILFDKLKFELYFLVSRSSVLACVLKLLIEDETFKSILKLNLGLVLV